MEKFFLKRKNAGYTIIETMIAISLFIIIVMAGMGALLNANLLHQKSKNMRSIIDNMSFIMEDMSKNMRTGYNFRCLRDASVDLNISNINTPQSGESCWGIAFESQDGDPADSSDQWVYYVGGNNLDETIRIYKAEMGPYDDFTNYIQLTSDEVEMDPLSGFSILGAESVNSGDNQQPLVTINLVGTITYKDTIVTPFSLQSSVSQRMIDVGN